MLVRLFFEIQRFLRGSLKPVQQLFSNGQIRFLQRSCVFCQKNLVVVLLIVFSLTACNNGPKSESASIIQTLIEPDKPDEFQVENTLLLVPRNPAPGEPFRLVATGGRKIAKASIIVEGVSGGVKELGKNAGKDLPCWLIHEFSGLEAGNYSARLVQKGNELSRLDFHISEREKMPASGKIWNTERGWNSTMETLYSAWVNALFDGCGEQSSWSALHEVTQNRDKNFLYNYLSLDEDNADSKVHVLMEPDCADSPYFLRAYFAWKLGLPFGYHLCDRGYLGKSPQTGQWMTNESSSSKKNPVLAFNSFIRMIMNGVHSGTARTAFGNNNSDYYPVALDRNALRPGAVFADPYGHTFVIVNWKNQHKDEPGVLFSVDAQPDKTIAIKRFWKGNFLFTTSEVVGEPGFKLFRPISYSEGKMKLLTNDELNSSSGFVPFSLQQQKMESDSFYLAMERLINPNPLDPEMALIDLLKSMHEQLKVRVQSVENGEKYMREHPGSVISMPSSAKGIFLTGGDWENFSTPNRDLRLLIAMDAVRNFPDRVASYPNDFRIPALGSPEKEKEKLQQLLETKLNELSIVYTRSDGLPQQLTLKEILDRQSAFEMAYNPNDGVEIRWGAPENSAERSTCKRQAPAWQRQNMEKSRKWFINRLHPPT